MKLGALEAGGTKMVCAIGNENGQIYKKETFPTRTPAETMPELISFFRKEKIDALGIACFGPVDLNTSSKTYGHITTTPKIAWQNYDIVGAFKDALNVPIGFDTDVNGSALGEYTYGIGRGLHSLVYITIGTGVGIGVIADGHLLHGMMHPEGGHALLIRHPEDKYEGNCPFHDSCVEGLAAGPSVEKRWGTKAINLDDNHRAWEIEAYYIAQAAYTYCVTLSPQRIILGGGIMHKECLLPLIRKYFKEINNGYIKTKETDDIDNYIVLQSLDDEQGILGALELGHKALL